MSSSPVVRESDRDRTTGRRQALGSLLGRVRAVDQVGDSFTVD